MLTEISLGGFIALQLGGVALFVSLAVTGFARLGGLGDIPDDRSAHARTTPTAGGLGIIAGIGAALVLAVSYHGDVLFGSGSFAPALASLLVCAFALGIMGVIDDRIVVPTTLKFCVISSIGLYTVWVFGPVSELPIGRRYCEIPIWLGVIGTVLWIFVVTNAVNFMDGINGLFGSTMTLALMIVCLVAIAADAPVTATLTGVTAAAILGFLPYNFRKRAAIFCGDCGSLPVGFLYAASILLLLREQPDLPLLYIGPLLIMPLLADVLLTLLLKPFRGLGFTAPHATHIYQRAARAFGNPLPVTLLYTASIGVMALWVNEALKRGTIGSFAELSFVVMVFALAYAVLNRLLPK